MIDNILSLTICTTRTYSIDFAKFATVMEEKTIFR